METNEKLDDLVRYEISQENDENDNYIDYEFAYGMNTTSNNIDNIDTINLHTNNPNGESKAEFELNHNNRFYGLSHFDESSRADFGKDSIETKSAIKKNITHHYTRQPSNSYTNNTNNSNNSKIINTNPYQTNLSNLNQNFNFNNDSEIDKIDFNSNYLDKKMENIFEQEEFLNHVSSVLNSTNNNSSIKKHPSTTKSKTIHEIKSAVNLVNEGSEGINKRSGAVCKSIEENDRVNLIDSRDTYKNNYNLEKYKIPSPKKSQGMVKEKKEEIIKYISSANTEVDLEIELEAYSEQIINYNKFENSTNKENTDLNLKINNNNKDNEDGGIENDIELEYIIKLKELKNENNDLKMKLKVMDKLNSSIANNHNTTHSINKSNSEVEFKNKNLKEELEEMRIKLEKKSRESLDNKSKYDIILFDYEVLEKKLSDLKSQISNFKNEISDKENILTNMKLDIRKKEEQYQGLTDDNQNYKQQMENIKVEFNQHRHEMTKKAEKVTELQQRIFNLEQENIEIRSKSTGELMNSRDQKQSFDTLKSNFMDMKNQNDLLNIKFQRIYDENFNMKRDIVIYEKELNSKNELIENYKLELEHKKNTYEPKAKEKIKEKEIEKEKEKEMDVTYDYNNIYSKHTFQNFNNFKNKIPTSNNNNNRRSLNNSSINEIKNDNLNNSSFISHNESNNISNNTSTRTSFGVGRNTETINNINNRNSHVFPSQKDIVKKESRILEIETKLYTLQRERDKVSSELSRMPEYPKQKAQILQKKNYELSINEYIAQINTFKIELRELNAFNRDY